MRSKYRISYTIQQPHKIEPFITDRFDTAMGYLMDHMAIHSATDRKRIAVAFHEGAVSVQVGHFTIERDDHNV